MGLRYSKHFLRSYAKAPLSVQKAFDKQAALLLQDLNHPSLLRRGSIEATGLWQGRVNYSWRFYFKIQGNVFLLEEIRNHPK